MPEFIGQIPYNWWAFILLGLFAGTLSGMLGLGSGTIIIPALVLLLGLQQKSAQGMCLAAILPMALVGAVRYKMDPTIDISILKVGLIAAGGILGAFVGVEIALKLSGGVLRKIFSCFIIAVALRMLFTPNTHKPASDKDKSVECIQEQSTESSIDQQ